MDGFALVGILIGAGTLLFAWNREYGEPVDALSAARRMKVHGPGSPPPLFLLGGATAGVAVAFAFPELGPPGRSGLALLFFAGAWLLWLSVWSSFRALLDAAVVFQDHVPLRMRPPEASAPAPQAALSFRPFTAAAALLLALLLSTGAVATLGFVFEWTRRLPLLAAAIYSAIGVGFAAYVRGAVTAERRERRLLLAPSSADDAELLESLRRNPRSPRLLMEHARRLEDADLPVQALLEYEASLLYDPVSLEARQAVRRLRDALGEVGPIEGSIVRERGSALPAMQVTLLSMPQGSFDVRIVDLRAFLRELLVTPLKGGLLSVEGRVESGVETSLRPYLHLAPLLFPPGGAPAEPERAWRLTPEVVGVLERYVEDHDVERDWLRLRLYTVDRLIAEAWVRTAHLRVSADALDREYAEWRRAGVVTAAPDA